MDNRVEHKHENVRGYVGGEKMAEQSRHDHVQNDQRGSRSRSWLSRTTAS